MAKHNEIGTIGEGIAREFLESKGYFIKDKNYRRKYGEIDIVALDSKRVWCFIEVKSVSHEMGERGVPYETYRPEENVHPQKVKRLLRVIEEYLVSHEIDGEWQFDVLAVHLDTEKKTAKVRHLRDIILGS